MYGGGTNNSNLLYSDDEEDRLNYDSDEIDYTGGLNSFQAKQPLLKTPLLINVNVQQGRNDLLSKDNTDNNMFMSR